MISKGELRRHELIGLYVEVVSSTHSGYVGIRGRVVDETKHMLIIESAGVEKKVPKATCVFEFDDQGRKERVRGSEIEFKPEDRIKRAR